MESVSLSDAKAHLSAIMDRVEAGEEVTVVRRGKPVGTIVPISKPRKPIDFDRIRTLREAMTMSDIDSVDLIREMRDAGY